jgi:hypothetical protein
VNRFVAALLVLVLIGWWQSQPAKLELPPGAKAPDIPLQSRLKHSKTFDLNGYQIAPQALFELEAKVLAKKRYRTDRGAILAPYDLALGWGVMSDQAVVNSLNIRQTGRWYMFRTNSDSFPYPMDVISQSSANMHMVPSDDSVSEQLDKITVGSIARFTGKLVNISHEDGFHWNSSLTRTDRGGGACELFYVETITVLLK